MRTTRVPWLPLMLALVIAFVGTVVMFGKASAEASQVTEGNVCASATPR